MNGFRPISWGPKMETGAAYLISVELCRHGGTHRPAHHPAREHACEKQDEFDAHA
jgi:hypothetical protein